MACSHALSTKEKEKAPYQQESSLGNKLHGTDGTTHITSLHRTLKKKKTTVILIICISNVTRRRAVAMTVVCITFLQVDLTRIICQTRGTVVASYFLTYHSPQRPSVRPLTYTRYAGTACPVCVNQVLFLTPTPVL